jgi:type I restriction enzyme M protein
LNIPRYVDTFETEEEIDINFVAESLVELEKEMKDTDKELVGFCKELGISAPF